jgi:hypothetical protein
MPDGLLNENGYAHACYGLLFFGLLSLANIYIRVSKDRAKRAASKASARPKKIQKASNSFIGRLLPADKLKPGPWSIYSQVRRGNDEGGDARGQRGGRGCEERSDGAVWAAPPL